MNKCWHLSVTLVIAMASGCAQPVSTSTSAATQVGSTAVVATLPTLSSAISGSSTVPAESVSPRGKSADAHLPQDPVGSAPDSPQPEIGELFAPPKAVAPPVVQEQQSVPVPEPSAEESKTETAIPQLRLIGFVEGDGLKALLSIDGKLNVMTTGETTDGLQIVTVNPPAVTLKYGVDGEEFQLNLFDQPWFHQPANENNSLGGKPVPPRRPAIPATPGSRGSGNAFLPPLPSKRGPILSTGIPPIGNASAVPAMPSAELPEAPTIDRTSTSRSNNGQNSEQD